jgi:hypothetical protein
VPDFDEALRNIDIFCKVLVKKIVDEENREDSDVVVEPMEKLLYKKCVAREPAEVDSVTKHLIPVPQLEEPLIDVIDDGNHVKVLVEERCRDNKVTVHTEADGIEICKTECHKNAEGSEVCQDRCQKLPLRTDNLQIENMSAKCNNNIVLEVDIPKKPSY